MHFVNAKGILSSADQYGFGFTLIAKSSRILKDLDLLKSINAKTKCVAQITLTAYNESLCKILEPNDISIHTCFMQILLSNRSKNIIIKSLLFRHY